MSEYDSASNPPIPRLSGVPYLCRYVNEPIARTPAAPGGPSDAELNYVPPDPMLVPYGGSSNALFALISGAPSAAPAIMRGTALERRN